MKVLITGGSGLLGSKISEKTVEKGFETYSGFNAHKSRFGTPTKLDICNRNVLTRVFENIEPEVVIHTAAITNVDKCEIDKELAWEVNVGGTRNVAELSRKHKAFLIHVSTDYVFSGKKGNYIETDKTDPINCYGVTKLEGEKIVKAITDEWCIARPSVIYGSTPSAGKVNFALWILENLQKRQPIKIVTDQRVSPTFNTNLAEMIVEVAERKLRGIYHLAGATPMNRYEFAKSLAQISKLDKHLIQPVKSEEMRWKAKRPKNTSLNIGKASRELYSKPLKIEEALKRLKEEINKETKAPPRLEQEGNPNLGVNNP